MVDLRSDPLAWRIQMLADGSGFTHRVGIDDFGSQYGGPALNGKTVSIRSHGTANFVMRVPAMVAYEMRKDAAVGAAFTVDANGLVEFVDGGPNADTALKRAAALMRSLPDTPVAVFKDKIRGMPASTEVERLIKQRIGQDIFRACLEDYWGGCCPITGIADRALLRASHTKPWAECETDEERLDVYNGFLLAVHLDAAFDAALLTFGEDGTVLFSPRLSERAREVLGEPTGSVRLSDEHQEYLGQHRKRFNG